MSRGWKTTANGSKGEGKETVLVLSLWNTLQAFYHHWTVVPTQLLHFCTTTTQLSDWGGGQKRHTYTEQQTRCKQTWVLYNVQNFTTANGQSNYLAVVCFMASQLKMLLQYHGQSAENVTSISWPVSWKCYFKMASQLKMLLQYYGQSAENVTSIWPVSWKCYFKMAS